MKSGEAAKLLGVDPKTIANWIDRDELRGFFSPTARKEGINQRIFTDNDFAILNTIRYATVADRASFSEVAALIESGELIRDVPVNAAFSDTRVIPETQAIEQSKTAAAEHERDLLSMQLASADQRIAMLEQRLAEEQAGRREDVERLMREIVDARAAQREAETLVKLKESEIMLKLYESGRLKPQ